MLMIWGHCYSLVWKTPPETNRMICTYLLRLPAFCAIAGAAAVWYTVFKAPHSRAAFDLGGFVTPEVVEEAKGLVSLGDISSLCSETSVDMR
jgi:hypothetical protein